MSDREWAIQLVRARHDCTCYVCKYQEGQFYVRTGQHRIKLTEQEAEITALDGGRVQRTQITVFALSGQVESSNLANLRAACQSCLPHINTEANRAKRIREAIKKDKARPLFAPLLED